MKYKIQYKIFLTCALIFAYVIQVYGQNLKTISSQLVDENGSPISGAVIYVQEGNVNSTTDNDGNFSIEIDSEASNDFLLISAKGYNDTLVNISVVLNSEEGAVVKLSKPDFHLGADDEVNLPFGKMKKRHIVGSVTSVKTESIIGIDASTNIARSDYVVFDKSGDNAIYGRIPGVFNVNNIHGFGGATVVIDGVPRSDFSLNIQEIDEISVLKDPTSRILYGSQADKGIVYITTKRGTPYKRTLKIYAESGIDVPISYPEYLNSADYMTLYNEAALNDGAQERYSAEQISNAQNGITPLDSPDGVADQDYYNSDYLRDNTNFMKLNAEASGGNDKAQYYANLGWIRGNTLLDIGEESNAHYNSISIRGNVDYNINDYVKANLDIISSYSFNESANYFGSGFWGNSTSLLPNQYPVLIPVESLPEDLEQSAFPVDGYVYGGANGFTENVEGELRSRGFKTTNQYIVQLNSGLELDLNPFVKGLTAKASVTFDFFNINELRLDKEYAVYGVEWDTSSTGADSIMFNRITLDNAEGSNTIEGIYFQRRLGFYGLLNYDRNFGIHHVNATAMAYTDQYKEDRQIYTVKNLTIGGRLNYAYNDKYVAEFSGASVGSGKLPEDNRFGFSYAFGLAWVLSEESFLQGASFVDYLKIKASMGRLLNDRIQNSVYNEYYLYNSSLERGGNYQWNDQNNNITNNRYVIQNVGNPNLDWVKRDEFVVGLEANLLGSLWLQLDYFQSTVKDMVTRRYNTQPVYLGVLPYENYNDDQYKGFDIGLNYTKKLGDLEFNLGLNMAYVASEILKRDEPVYEYDHLYRKGTSTRALWGLESDGLYQTSDFEVVDYENQVFTLRDGVVSSSYGTVQPGDIKYKDQTGDNNIDDEDITVIGHGFSKIQFSIPLSIKYKSIELYVLGIGQRGDDNFRSGAYYWVYGDRKYSEVVNDRYHYQNNPNGTYPRLSSKTNNHNFRASDYWLYDNDWFEIKTVQLTYTLPQSISRMMYMDNFKVYVRGNNLLTFGENSDLRKLNVGWLPQMRHFSAGINVSF